MTAVLAISAGCGQIPLAAGPAISANPVAPSVRTTPAPEVAAPSGTPSAPASTAAEPAAAATRKAAAAPGKPATVKQTPTHPTAQTRGRDVPSAHREPAVCGEPPHAPAHRDADAPAHHRAHAPAHAPAHHARTNNYRNSSQGGFRPNLPSSDANSSERLTDYPGQYDYAIVINFNRQPYSDQKAYRGAGIFLHVNGSGATAGCVSLTRTNLLTVFSYLRPGDRITIVR